MAGDFLALGHELPEVCNHRIFNLFVFVGAVDLEVGDGLEAYLNRHRRFLARVFPVKDESYISMENIPIVDFAGLWILVCHGYIVVLVTLLAPGAVRIVVVDALLFVSAVIRHKIPLLRRCCVVVVILIVGD